MLAGWEAEQTIMQALVGSEGKVEELAVTHRRLHRLHMQQGAGRALALSQATPSPHPTRFDVSTYLCMNSPGRQIQTFSLHPVAVAGHALPHPPQFLRSPSTMLAQYHHGELEQIVCLTAWGKWEQEKCL